MSPLFAKLSEITMLSYYTAWLFELAGGAVADNDGTCLPKAQREASFTIAAFHQVSSAYETRKAPGSHLFQWEMGDDDPLCVTTAENVCVCSLAARPS